MSLQEYKNVKGFTFVQSTEPSEDISQDNDTWYNTSDSKVYMFQFHHGWRVFVESINLPGANYGYSMGGYSTSSYMSSIDRIHFPFDFENAVCVGNLTEIKSHVSGCNSTQFGYCLSGKNSDNTYGFSSVDRITFPFDSGTATHVGNLSESKYALASCNNSTYGYSMGGYWYSTIDRITFPFDSGITSHVGNLSGSRYSSGSCNSDIYGYCFGGNDRSDRLSNIERITFPFDSGTASHIGNLSGTRYYNTGCNSSTNGYSMGGTYLSLIDRITFPFDSGTATHVGNLSESKYAPSACNSTVYGYCLGGNNISVIDRITFPFDSGTALHYSNLSGTRGYSACMDGTDFNTYFYCFK